MFKNKRILIISLLIILFFVVAIYANTKPNLIIDEKVYKAISMLHSNCMTMFFKTITVLGNVKVIGCVCIILLLLNKTRKTCGIPITIAMIISGILNITLKNIFGRERPLLEQLVFEDSFSFPSGHAMGTATIFSMIIYLSCKYIKNKKVKYTVNIISGILIFLIGISRIYLRVHFFTDVLTGWCLGIAITLVYSLIFDRIDKKMYKINQKA